MWVIRLLFIASYFQIKLFETWHYRGSLIGIYSLVRTFIVPANYVLSLTLVARATVCQVQDISLYGKGLKIMETAGIQGKANRTTLRYHLYKTSDQNKRRSQFNSSFFANYKISFAMRTNYWVRVH